MARDVAVRTYPVRRFVDLADVRSRPGIVTLDVRRDDEWDAGHIDGAVHMPLHHIVEHMDELPPGTIWVHCAAGFRAGIAASLLAREGRNVVLVDDRYATRPPAHRHGSGRRVPRGEAPHPSQTGMMATSDRVGTR
jgi:hydroxyacylglutathione hydrolase